MNIGKEKRRRRDQKDEGGKRMGGRYWERRMGREERKIHQRRKSIVCNNRI